MQEGRRRRGKKQEWVRKGTAEENMFSECEHHCNARGSRGGFGGRHREAEEKVVGVGAGIVGWQANQN